jgi:hypothetical protein
MMENRFILSPFFLDEPLPELETLASLPDTFSLKAVIVLE